MKRLVMLAVVVSISGTPAYAQDQPKVSVQNMPPVVVKTEPQSGDTKVDSSVKEIRVTFSKKMDGGYVMEHGFRRHNSRVCR